MNKQDQKLWTKDFLIVSSVNFLITLVFFLLMVTIALFAVEAYGATEAQAGLVTGIFIIGTLIGRIFIGRFIDAIGRKKTLVIGLFFFTTTTCLYFWETGITILLITRFLHGMTLGMASTAAGTIVAQIIPASRKGEGIGYFSLSSTLATAIGPFIGLFMIQHSSFQTIFIFCLLIGVINLITSLFVHIPPIEKKLKTTGFKISDFIEPRAVPIAAVMLVIALCFSSILSFINFYALELQLVNAASFFFIVYAAAIMISRPFTGRLLDLKGGNFVLYPAMIILAGGMLLLSTASTGTALLIAAALIGLGFGNIQSCIQAIAIKLTPPHRMGLATSTFFIFLDAGLGFGPYFLGMIIPHTGYQTLYFLMATLTAICIGLYFLLYGKKERSGQVNVTATL